MKKVISLLLVMVSALFVLSGCLESSSSSYDETLKRGLEKSYSGAPMTSQEQKAVNSYKKWEKEYDAQQYNKKHYGN